MVGQTSIMQLGVQLIGVFVAQEQPSHNTESIHSTIESCRNHIQQGVPETPLLIEHFIQLLYLKCVFIKILLSRISRLYIPRLGEMMVDVRCAPSPAWYPQRAGTKTNRHDKNLIGHPRCGYSFTASFNTQINILNHKWTIAACWFCIPYFQISSDLWPRHIIRQCKVVLKPWWIRSDQQFLLLQVHVFTRPCTTGR